LRLDQFSKGEDGAIAKPVDGPLEKQAIRKITWRLIPFLMLLYFVAFLDRINVGFGALTMNEDVGLTATMFGLGSERQHKLLDELIRIATAYPGDAAVQNSITQLFGGQVRFGHAD
jgi:hypothetical protein